MSHYHEIEDEGGNLVELVPFCGDSCHRSYCDRFGIEYGGWNGAHEADADEFCANCGVLASIGNETVRASECVAVCGPPIVVGRAPSEEGERCEHGNWTQLPHKYLPDVAYG